MIEKASIYTMNALNKSSELWNTSGNRKARPVVGGEHEKKWNNHGYVSEPTKEILETFCVVALFELNTSIAKMGKVFG